MTKQNKNVKEEVLERILEKIHEFAGHLEYTADQIKDLFEGRSESEFIKDFSLMCEIGMQIEDLTLRIEDFDENIERILINLSQRNRNQT